MNPDAIVLAGGRGSRLGGRDKAAIELDGVTLLDRALAAVGAAGGTPERTVVVGPPRTGLPSGTIQTRERPPFGGPAAAVAAGLAALGSGGDGAEFTLVIAVDLVRSAAAVRTLRDSVGATADDGADGWVARDPGGRAQPLLGLYRTRPLVRAAAAGALDGRSMHTLLAPLRLHDVALRSELTSDIDTPADLRGATALLDTRHL